MNQIVNSRLGAHQQCFPLTRPCLCWQQAKIVGEEFYEDNQRRVKNSMGEARMAYGDGEHPKPWLLHPSWAPQPAAVRVRGSCGQAGDSAPGHAQGSFLRFEMTNQTTDAIRSAWAADPAISVNVAGRLPFSIKA